MSERQWTRAELVERLQETAEHTYFCTTDWLAAVAEEAQAATDMLEADERALEECASPFVLGHVGDPLNYEHLAREFNHRQAVATKALGKLTTAELAARERKGE